MCKTPTKLGRSLSQIWMNDECSSGRMPFVASSLTKAHLLNNLSKGGDIVNLQILCCKILLKVLQGFTNVANSNPSLYLNYLNSWPLPNHPSYSLGERHSMFSPSPFPMAGGVGVPHPRPEVNLKSNIRNWEHFLH